ncbi:response regulator [Piscinibacter sp. HJYY11]|uniref:response regulator n=1 Tax=Piscinibacter sp. HJYY11 TaxID=2801333 RepID=UPI00191D016E|nr:response regulator [Piscinibacter sp. HJYY11]MBL0728703.1 response regulator [Piscinibacter sp. HJYY11]
MGRLLILDDDPTVGQILQVAAKSVGFEARWCEDVDAFFSALAEWQPTHLAVDMLMPDVSGQEVLARLADQRCEAKVIVSSGMGAGELDTVLDEAQALGLNTVGTLPKPFSLASVRALLAA